MDEQSVTSNNKIQKLKAEDINNAIRSLDDLPEAILAHIISFLPMKDALRTSVLSKKWEFLWTSVPNLKFIERPFSNEVLFMKSVDRVLLLHDPSPIKNFYLENFSSLPSDSQFNEWVTAAVRHNVELFTLKLCTYRNFVLPWCLFTCETLVKLHLQLQCTLRLPSQIHLPKLKSLHLKGVLFSDECSTQSLFSSPTIESLHILNCCWSYLRAITISSPKLKHLGLSYLKGDFDETIGYHCQVSIRDCNLESFYLKGPMFSEYLVSNLSAINVSLDINYDDWKGEELAIAIGLKNVFQETRAVQDLSFKDRLFYLNQEKPEWNFCWSDFPIFDALNTLEVDKLGCRCNIGVLVNILQRSPQLHTLIVNKGLDICGLFGCNESDNDEDDEVSDHDKYVRPGEDDDVYDQDEDACHGEDVEVFDQVPLCFSSSLKKITVGGLHLKRGELRVLKTMLKCAMVLEEFLIFPYYKNDRKFGHFCSKLMHCSRGSKNCELIFL